jgi:hypothetical protein
VEEPPKKKPRLEPRLELRPSPRLRASYPVKKTAGRVTVVQRKRRWVVVKGLAILAVLVAGSIVWIRRD